MVDSNGDFFVGAVQDEYPDGSSFRSYTAVQKQQKISGSLFRKEKKSICMAESQGVSPACFNTHYGMLGNLDLPETNYLNVCFDYLPKQKKTGAHLDTCL